MSKGVLGSFHPAMFYTDGEGSRYVGAELHRYTDSLEHTWLHLNTIIISSYNL